MRLRLAFCLACLLGVTLAPAQGSPIESPSNPDSAASAADQARQRNFARDVLSKMGVDQHLGAQVPADATFQDEHGRSVKFGDLYGGRPIVIMPMFFECKGVCGVETDELMQTVIRIQDLNVGREFDIVMLSINPKETPELTLPRWTSTVRLYNRPGGDNGFHFLTGKYDEIHKVTDALGFKWVYDPKEDTINHPAGLMVLSPQGQITGYLINKEFPQPFLTRMIRDARESKISPKTENILFGCIMIDHATGRRSLVIENVIRLCAAVFAIGLAFWIVGMSVSDRRRKGAGGVA